MNEELIQFSWMFRLYNALNLHTLHNQKVEVIDPGQWNRDSGPDFFNSKIKIDKTIWVGNVEIHKNASEWQLHQHHLDPAYNNVVLHVVINPDKRVLNQLDKEIPTLVLPVYDYVISNYEKIKNTKVGLPCQDKIRNISELFMSDWLTSLQMERLNSRVDMISSNNLKTTHNWDSSFYHSLFKSFGSNKNAMPFELLAKSLPEGMLEKYSTNSFLLEALLFGQAGFLDELLAEDDYYMQLAAEYRFIANKHKLRPIQKHLWKFLRLRPGNFPTVRIAQLTSLLSSKQRLLSQVLECETLKELRRLLSTNASSYWTDHYRFNVPSPHRKKALGAASIDSIIINTIVPITFSWGKEHGDDKLCDKALNWLETLKPEKNHIVTMWKNYGFEAKSAFETQALIQLNNSYCLTKNCIRCRIGHQIIAKPVE